MATIVLDGGQMTSREAAHDYLARQLRFPEWYGRNLDALYDLLTELGTPTRLVIRRRAALEEALEDYGRALLSTLAEAAGKNPNLAVEFDQA